MSVADSPAVRRVGRIALIAWAVFGFVFLFTPIVITVIYSFNEPAGPWGFPPVAPRCWARSWVWRW